MNPVTIRPTAEQWEAIRPYVSLARRAGDVIIGLDRVVRFRGRQVILSDREELPDHVDCMLHLWMERIEEVQRALGIGKVRILGIPRGNWTDPIMERLVTEEA